MIKNNKKALQIIFMVLCSVIVTVLFTSCTKSFKLTVPLDIVFNDKSSTLTWTKTPNALSYEVAVTKDPAVADNTNTITYKTDDNSYTLSDAGIQYMRVRAIGNGSLLITSEYSAWLKCTNIIKLTSLNEVSRKFENKTGTITFKHDKNAIYYDFNILKNGTIVQSSSIRINNDGAETFDIAFAVDSVADYTIEYTMVGDGIFSFKSEKNAVIFLVKLPRPISDTVNYDKNDSSGITIHYNTFFIPVTQTVFDGKVLNPEFTEKKSDISYVLNLPKKALDECATGEYNVELHTAYGVVTIDIIITDSRKIGSDITEFTVITDANKNLVVEIDNLEYKLQRLQFGNATSFRILEEDEYVFDVSSGLLTVIGTLFNREVGQYHLLLTFENKDTVRLNISIVSASTPYLPIAQFTYDKKGSTQSKGIEITISNHGSNSFTVFNDDYDLDDLALGGYIITKFNSSNMSWTITILPEYLNKLTLRTYTFAIFSTKQLSFSVDITDRQAKVSNPRLDIDTKNNELFLYWDTPLPHSQYEVTINNSTYLVGTPKISLTYLTYALMNPISIRIKGSSVENTFSIENDTQPYIIGDTDFTKYLYSFGGKVSNYYMTSFTELVDFFEFFYFSIVKDGKLPVFMNKSGEYYQLEENSYVNICVAPTAYSGTGLKNFYSAASMKAASNVENIRNGIMLSVTSLGGNALRVSYQYATNINNFTPIYGSGQSIEQPSPITPPCYIGYVPKRGENYTFAIDKNALEQVVYNSSQLYFAVEMGYKPLPVANSPAERIYSSAKEVMKKIVDDNMDDYTKVHYIYDWLITNVTYDSAIINNSGVSGDAYFKYFSFYLEGVFNTKVAVCDGISKAFVLLCAIEGIDSYRARGIAGGAHAWNKAYIDGKWYGFDATWGDRGEGILTHEFAFCTELSLSEKHSERESYLDSNGNKKERDNTYKIANGVYDIYSATPTLKYAKAMTKEALLGLIRDMQGNMYYTFNASITANELKYVLSQSLPFTINCAYYQLSSGAYIVLAYRLY